MNHAALQSPVRTPLRRAWSLALLASFVLLTTGCQRTPTVQSSPEQAVTNALSGSAVLGPQGGAVRLGNGGRVDITPGALGQAADVRLSARTDAARHELRLELPAQALTTSGGLDLTVPASWRAGRGTTGRLTVERADGTRQTTSYPQSMGLAGPDARGVPETVTVSADRLGAAAGQVGATVVVTFEVFVPSSGAAVTPLSLNSGFAWKDVVSGLALPIAFDFAAEGRIFIAEKSGRVRVSINGALQSTPFIDLSSQVNNTADRGLLGLAVHPQFPQQPYVYLLFTYDPPEVAGRTGNGGPDGGGARVARLVRVTADAAQQFNVAVPGSDVVLLGNNSTYANIGNPDQANGVPSCERNGIFTPDCLPADELSHTIGTVRFAPDGSLLVSNGDGADYSSAKPYATRSVKLDSLAGKILRIDPMTGRGYSTNPFATSDLGSNRSKVYNLGLRNPFRFTLHPTTALPYIGDVGWNAWEEVNTGRGKNFGWPCYEGGNTVNLQSGAYSGLSDCQALYRENTASPAVYAYPHNGQGSSIQVGDFYTGSNYPSTYANALFVTDFNLGWIKYLKFDAAGNVTSVNDFGVNEHGIVQVRRGPGGDLYFLNIYSGTLRQLQYTERRNTAPTAVATATPTQGETPLTVAFSSAGSADPDGDPLSFSWTFGNGGTSTAANPTHTYSTQGTYEAVLTVTDPAGASSTARVAITVGQPAPQVTITTPTEGTRYNAGDVIGFSGGATDGRGQAIPADRLAWSLRLHHEDHVHPDQPIASNGTQGSFTVSDHGDNTRYDLCLTATDTLGRSSTKCVTLRPNTVLYTITSTPPGLKLNWQGVDRITPFTVETVVNGARQVGAPDQSQLTFSRWSDGSGAPSRVLTIGSASQTLTAAYASPGGCATGVHEAETGALTGFNVISESTASNGRSIVAPKSTKSASLDSQVRALYCFQVTTPGRYRIRGRVHAPNNASNALFVTVNGQPTRGYLWTPVVTKTYALSTVNDSSTRQDVEVQLAAGEHWVAVHPSEPGTKLDTLQLERLP